MKRCTMYGVIAMALFIFSCQKEIKTPNNDENTLRGISNGVAITECGTPLKKDLQDEGGIVDKGDVIISNDNDNITLRFISSSPITRIRLVYGSLEHVSSFITSGFFYSACEGPPAIDREVLFDPGVTDGTILIPNSNFQADNCIWISVFVMFQDGTCAYADPYDELIFSLAWQSAFKYCRQECPPDDCGPLRTQTPGGWGAKPEGHNPGTYLHANFDDAFTNLVVGCAGGYTLTLTNAQAITDLLPTGGKPAALKASSTDPAAIKNELVGQLVALTLSVGFDVNDPDFGEAGITLGNMVIGSGLFEGKTVNEFLAIANNVLGGCSTAYTPSQINETATAINENYDDGKVDKGFLVCPNDL